MPKPRQIPRKATKQDGASRKSKRARKSQLLVHGAPSVTRSIADAICIKNGNLYFVTESDGSVPIEGSHGYGLYYHDCRYLNAYRMHIADSNPIVLAAATGAIGTATFELTNPHLEFGDGKQLPSGQVGIAWQRHLDPDGMRLLDSISFKNYSQNDIKFPITLAFSADFEDVFAVRGTGHVKVADAAALGKIAEVTGGKEPRNVIVVQNRIVNVVV